MLALFLSHPLFDKNAMSKFNVRRGGLCYIGKFNFYFPLWKMSRRWYLPLISPQIKFSQAQILLEQLFSNCIPKSLGFFKNLPVFLSKKISNGG